MLLNVLKRKFLSKDFLLTGDGHLTGTEGALDMPGTGVAGVVLPPVQVLHHPVQPPSEVVLGPPLAVVKEQLLGSLPSPLSNLDTVPTSNYNLHLLKALHVTEVGLAVKYGSIDSILVRLFIE